jgi:hypothetical protein
VKCFSGVAGGGSYRNKSSERAAHSNPQRTDKNVSHSPPTRFSLTTTYHSHCLSTEPTKITSGMHRHRLQLQIRVVLS